MPQTLLAILGLMVTVLLSFGTQRDLMSSQRGMIANELEVMATGIALEAMETIRTRAFDPETIGATGVVSRSNFEYHNNANHFTPNSACSVFGMGTDDCNDIGDFHRMKTATIDFEMNDSTKVPFLVDVEVRYVKMEKDPITDEATFVRANERTYQKEVIVSVQDAAPNGQRPYLTRPIYLTRTFSYNFGLDSGTSNGGGVIQDEDESRYSTLEKWFFNKIENDELRDDFAEIAEEAKYHELSNAIMNQDKAQIKKQLDENPQAKEYLRKVREAWTRETESSDG